MSDDLLSKKNIIIFLIIVLGLVILTWIIIPTHIKKSQYHNKMSEGSHMEMPTEHDISQMNGENMGGQHMVESNTHENFNPQQENIPKAMNEETDMVYHRNIMQQQGSIVDKQAGGVPFGKNMDQIDEQVNNSGYSDNNMPYVNPKTGSVIDGPGSEKGPVDGISSDQIYTLPSNYYFLDDGAGGEMSVQHNLCSKSCCSEQWPTPFKQKYDPYVCGNKSKFVPKILWAEK
jgi:hypothetical protein